MIDIKQFRKDNKLSQVELAAILGCTQGFISSLERNRRPVPDEIITKLISSNKYNTKHLIQEIHEIPDKKKLDVNDDVTMSREVFDVLKNLSETVLSQQRTIEHLHIERKKEPALQEESVKCADVSGSDLVK